VAGLVVILAQNLRLGQARAEFLGKPPEFSWTRLVVDGSHSIYHPGDLSETGVVGGYVRRSEVNFPIDVATLWDSSGAATSLPVSGTYVNAYVFGFDPDGTPIGRLGRPGVPGMAGYWSTTDFVPLTDLGRGAAASAGDGNVIVGQAFLPDRQAATIWDVAGPRPIDGLEGVESLALAINTDGTYVGVTIDTSDPSDWEYGGFVGRNGIATRFDFPGFTEPRGLEINDDGWITGTWEPAFATQRGFLARYDLDTGDNESYDLGLFPGYDEAWANAINNDRTVVGGAQRLGGDYDRALIWWQGSLMPQDLNLFVDIPDATLIYAYRINNAGQILAEARLHAGGFAYYVLTPVPEPAAAGVVGLAVLLLVRRRRRCHWEAPQRFAPRGGRPQSPVV
jgi:MYXO-CTERM domain-containing protein